jgi:hypothetical protein
MSRRGEPLDGNDEAIKTKCLVLILRELHEKIDSLVSEAYGWPENLSDDEILAKLVALNAERSAEEKRGLVRWLRPDYQRARAGVAPGPAQAPNEEQLEAPLIVEAGKVQKPAFPQNDLERTAAVFAALMQASEPLEAASLAKSFRQGAKVEATIARVLASLARLGHVHSSDGKTFALRRVNCNRTLCLSPLTRLRSQWIGAPGPDRTAGSAVRRYHDQRKKCPRGRVMLNWTKPKLAEAAGLGLSTVVDFERSRRIVSGAAVQAIRRALESAGVEFTIGDEPGVKLRKGGPRGDPAAAIAVEDLTSQNDD